MSGTVTLPLDVPGFRAMVPEFADSSIYLDSDILTWLTAAAQLLDPDRWRTLLNIGIAQFTAHNLVLDRQSQKTAQRGGIPGQTAGIISGKSLGGGSISYDTQSGVETDAGYWNLTMYGRRFYRYMTLVGMGGAQVSGVQPLVGYPYLVGEP